MRKFMFFAAMLSCFFAYGSPKERHGWDGPILHGDVKSVTAEYYQIKEESGEIVYGDLMSYHVYKFDPSHGNCIEKIEYDSDGQVRQKHTYLYDSGRRPIDTKTDSDAYSYDSNGNLIEYVDGKTDIRHTYEYDSDGNCIVEKHYGSDGQLSEEHMYEYDSHGNCIMESINSSLHMSSLVYDSHGNCIEKKDYTDNLHTITFDGGVKYKIEYFE